MSTAYDFSQIKKSNLFYAVRGIDRIKKSPLQIMSQLYEIIRRCFPNKIQYDPSLSKMSIFPLSLSLHPNLPAPSCALPPYFSLSIFSSSSLPRYTYLSTT